MLSATQFACESLFGSACISCRMDMKDGSKQAWAAVPARGFSEWPWAAEFVADRMRTQVVFLDFKCERGSAGAVAHSSAVAGVKDASSARVKQG